MKVGWLAWVVVANLSGCAWLGSADQGAGSVVGEAGPAPADAPVASDDAAAEGRSAPDGVVPPPEPDADGWLPTPFTADQIREAMPVGAFRDFRNTVADGAVARSHFEVIEADAEGALLTYSERRTDGEPTRAPQQGRESWDDLRLHARFPAADTRWLGEEEVEVPAGRFLARHYEVLKVEPGRPATVWDYWFAPKLPGPPVKFTVKQGGILLVTSELTGFGPVPTR